MKHLKTYENIQKYKKGDYILVKFIFDKPLSKHDRLRDLLDEENSAFAKIIELFYGGLGTNYRVTITSGYDIQVNKEEVVRKLTPDEIHKYNMMYDVNKYNL